MSFMDYELKEEKKPEESAREMTTANLIHELGKKHDKKSDDIVLIKEALRRILRRL